MKKTNLALGYVFLLFGVEAGVISIYQSTILGIPSFEPQPFWRPPLSRPDLRIGLWLAWVLRPGPRVTPSNGRAVGEPRCRSNVLVGPQKQLVVEKNLGYQWTTMDERCGRLWGGLANKN